jgi:GGDEF domain-containing protein
LEFSFNEIIVAVSRLLGRDVSGREFGFRLKYADFVDIMMPHNQEFSHYIAKRLHQESQTHLNIYQELQKGISQPTHLKLQKFFEDFIILENELEN